MDTAIRVSIEDSTLETRQKKGGGTYQVQTGYLHTFERNGQPSRYPQRFNFFPPRDNDGNPIPYKPGDYVLSPTAVRVNNGFIELGFPTFEPASKK